MTSYLVPVGLLIAALTGGCRQLAGLEDPLPHADGPLAVDGTGDQACYGTGTVRVCFATAPAGALAVTGTLSTDGTPPCAANVVSGGDGLCVVAAGSISVAAGVTIRGTGTKPLVLVADLEIVIAGTIDVASHRQGGRGAGANFAGCDIANQSTDGGGGAGGSFRGTGGAGGAPGGNPPGTTLAEPTQLHGGCQGHDGGQATGDEGKGGDGGGAVYFIGGTTIEVESTGVVNASGAGANNGDDGTSGGGGGGSGGMIGFDATSIAIDGTVFANGGGGSEGSTSGGGGGTGADSINGAAALGGTGGNGGDGGIGSAGVTLAGASGGTGTGGGGGGGGGAGTIVIFGTKTGTGTVSPQI
ncbi:MAG: hypothetical protein ABI867_29040 [Kofleriaceae bacterium]